MNVLVDTNLLVRFADLGDPDHHLAVDSLDRLDEQGHQLRIVPQNLYELWVVGTRPTDVNGLGFTPNQMSKLIDDFLALFPLLKDERTVVDRWQQIVVANEIIGKRAHDARLVAAMIRHGFNHILTFNAGDFLRFTDITVLTPADVVAGE